MRITKHNWYRDNLSKKLLNPNMDFEVYLTPYPFQKMDFWSSVELTVNEISKDYPNLYLALSGGYDSEFVLRAFYKFEKPITPIITRYGNEEESYYAYKACKELGITPIEIHLTDDQYLNYYYNTIYKPFSSDLIHCVHIHAAADYVSKFNGNIVYGFGPIGTYDNLVTEDFSSLPEWENYASFIYPSIRKIDFFYYTLELTYAQFPESDEGRWPEVKSKLFGLEYRPKIRPKYPPHVRNKLREIAGHLGSWNYIRMIEYNRQEWNSIFEPFIC